MWKFQVFLSVLETINLSWDVVQLDLLNEKKGLKYTWTQAATKNIKKNIR